MNANVLLATQAASTVVFSPMGQDLAEMERRRRKACKNGRTKAGRCRKRSRR